MATEVKLPELGEGVESAVVAGVLVKEGDQVEEGQPILELETDKAVMELPSPAAGIVVRVLVKEGDEVRVGQPILVMDAAAAEAAPAPAPQPSEEEKEEAPAAPEPPKAPPPPPARPEQAPRRLIPAAPSVRRLARELGVDLTQVRGTGLAGRITEEDVRRAAGGAPAAAGVSLETPPLPDFTKWGPVRREPASGIRRATARNMSQAWLQVPRVTHFDKADITELEAQRKRFAPRAEAAGARLTVTAIIVKVVAAALRKFPKFNASLDLAANEIVYKEYVHVGVAVDTPSGLLVPVIRDADKKSVIEIARELGELAERARARRLTPEEMQGATFSVSNLGGIGGTAFTPIVNWPEVAILAVARAAIEPVWDEASQSFKPRLMLPLGLSYDHRLIDGADAARFLRWVCEVLEAPILLPLEVG